MLLFLWTISDLLIPTFIPAVLSCSSACLAGLGKGLSTQNPLRPALGNSQTYTNDAPQKGGEV